MLFILLCHLFDTLIHDLRTETLKRSARQSNISPFVGLDQVRDNKGASFGVFTGRSGLVSLALVVTLLKKEGHYDS